MFDFLFIVTKLLLVSSFVNASFAKIFLIHAFVVNKLNPLIIILNNKASVFLSFIKFYVSTFNDLTEENLYVKYDEVDFKFFTASSNVFVT